MRNKAAFFLNSLRSAVSVIIGAPDKLAVQLVKAAAHKLHDGLGYYALPPEWHAQPEAHLRLARAEPIKAVFGQHYADASDGPSAFAQNNGIGFRRGENIMYDVKAVLNARVDGPAGYWANTLVFCIFEKLRCVPVIPRAQNGTLGF